MDGTSTKLRQEPNVVVAITETANTWQRIDCLLDALLSLTVPAREARLLGIADTDVDLAERLRHLLSSLERSVGLDNGAGPGLWADALHDLPGADDLGPGQAVGTWTLTARIGRGGMAEVFRAERNVNGACQIAALKVMTAGLFGNEQRRRFLQETAILARLDDPRLSRLIDAGSTDDGRPWLAMEHVDGIAIDQACDLQCLSIRERVALVREVALAVDQAHRQLIVHRDLKPANILVDDKSQVRVLDFGIARILQNEAGEVDATATIARAYTPRYACPEQLAGTSAGVAGDVYQLGLLLYLLLTGSHPFAAAGTDPASLLTAMREGPQAPSRRCLDADQAQAKRHGTTPARWSRLLRGDLDAIVLQALQPEPGARYANALLLAEDLDSFLAFRPVAATSPTLPCRVGRYFARKPLVSALAVALILTIAGAIGGVLWQVQEAVLQRDYALIEAEKAQRLADFMTSVFASANRSRTQGASISAKEVLDQAAERIQYELPIRDSVRSDLLASMANAYSGLGLRQQQLRFAEEALAIESGLNRPQVLTQRMVFAASALREASDAEKALELLETAVKRLNADSTSDPAFVGYVHYLLGLTHFSLRDRDASERSLELALGILRAAPNPRPRIVESTQLMLSRRWAERGRLDEALALVEPIVNTIRLADPPRPIDLLEALDALGNLYRLLERKQESTAAYQEALALAVKAHEPGSLTVAILKHNLARALEGEGAHVQALQLADQALATVVENVGTFHNFSVTARLTQIRLRCQTGDRSIDATDWELANEGVSRFPGLADRLQETAFQCEYRPGQG